MRGWRILQWFNRFFVNWHHAIDYPEPSEEQLAELVHELEVDEDALQSRTRALESEDFELIGEFIQVYCIADLYGRRILEDLSFFRKDQKIHAGSNNDTEVLDRLEAAAFELPLSDDWRDALRVIVRTLKMHRRIRHQFSHWACRRVLGHEVIIS